MKRTILRFTPTFLKEAWFSYREREFLKRNASTSARFSQIHASNMWKNPESVSGFGSTIAATEDVRAALSRICVEEEVDSILDIPCGDFNWMQHLEFSGAYTGADIVPAIVQSNQSKYGNNKRQFLVLDLVKDSLPKADLLLCRECLNHLSLVEGAPAIGNILSSASKVLVATHFPYVDDNIEQASSFRFRPLNLTLKPFFLREPDYLVEEKLDSGQRFLGVWLKRNNAIR